MYLSLIELIKSEYRQTEYFQMWLNTNKYLKIWDQTIHKVSYLLLFLSQYHILPYLFANVPFKIGHIGSVFTINDDLNLKLFI